jgi:hypothetical protein
MKEELTQEEALKRFHYDSRRGLLYSKVNTRALREGQIVGALQKSGNLALNVKGVTYLVHRVIWLMVYGKWPKGYLTHLDGDKTNNMLSNLAEKSYYENTKIVKGIAGINFVKKTASWKANLNYNGIQYYLGEYESKEEAIYARVAAEDCLGIVIDHNKSARKWLSENKKPKFEGDDNASRR